MNILYIQVVQNLHNLKLIALSQKLQELNNWKRLNTNYNEDSIVRQNVEARLKYRRLHRIEGSNNNSSSSFFDQITDVKPDTKFESFEDDILKGLHEILEYLNYYSNKGLRFAIDNHDSKVERINLAINYYTNIRDKVEQIHEIDNHKKALYNILKICSDTLSPEKKNFILKKIDKSDIEINKIYDQLRSERAFRYDIDFNDLQYLIKHLKASERILLSTLTLEEIDFSIFNLFNSITLFIGIFTVFRDEGYTIITNLNYISIILPLFVTLLLKWLINFLYNKYKPLYDLGKYKQFYIIFIIVEKIKKNWLWYLLFIVLWRFFRSYLFFPLI